MKTTLFTLFMIVFSNMLFSQLDTIHYFPPLNARADASVGEHFIYLSTPEVTPFSVDIKKGDGTVLATKTISSGSPASYQIGTAQNTSLFVPQTSIYSVLTGKGLIVSAGGHKFYAEIRVISNDSGSKNQASGFTGKGTAAIGNTFRIGVIPQYSDHNQKNFVIGFMSLSNNNTITISNITSGVKFVNSSGTAVNPNVNATTHSFTLNKGETYVLTGYTNVSTNLTGMIGALVQSTGQTVISTGNFCGSIINDASNTNRDAYLEQSVPVNKLGSDHVVIQGNGGASLEIPFVIAHSNNTEVYINGNATPITTLSAGQYFLIPNSNYQGTGHKNMYIRTSKPAYVYQALGGTNSTAQGDFNLIPPIHCRLSNKVDLIPSIEKIGTKTFSGDALIITTAGSSVKVNGTPISGAESVAGIGYETYKIKTVTGNKEIESTGPLLAGFIGYSGAADFSSFYTGFADVPESKMIAQVSPVCQGNVDSVLFIMTQGTQPYSFNYTINGVAAPVLNTSKDTTKVKVNTSTAGNLIYNITQVSSANTAGFGSCPYTRNDSLIVKIDAKPTLPTSFTVDHNTNNCHGREITLTATGGAVPGSAQYQWGTTLGGSELGTSTSNIKKFVPTASATYYVSLTGNGVCPAQNFPAGITYNLPSTGDRISGNNESATCYLSGNNPIHFYNLNAPYNYIGSINPNGRKGTLTMTSYINSFGSTIGVDDGTMFACNKPTNQLYRTAYMKRAFLVKDAFDPIGFESGADVIAYFPFTNSEFTDLKNRSTSASLSAGNSGGNGVDGVNTLANVHATKYDGTNENSNASDNCTGGTSVFMTQQGSGLLSSSGYSLSPAIINNSSGSVEIVNYAKFNVPNFSEFHFHGLNDNSPLPIKLTSFSGSCNNRGINLSWTTATETDVNHFEVYRTRDGQTWEFVVSINAVGNSSVTTNYAVLDPSGMESFYYKLRSVDTNGDSEDFDPISIQCNSSDISWSLFPNPSTYQVTLTIKSDKLVNDAISIIDLNGKLIMQQVVSLEKGVNHISLNVQSLAQGVYLVKLNDVKTYQPLKLMKID